MVTGAYLPELSGGGLQCRTMIHALRDRIRFHVLTTCTDPGLEGEDNVEGVPVVRVFVDVRRRATKLAAFRRMTTFMVQYRREFSVVHLHGFSQKSLVVILLARLLGKRIILTIHTAEHDEPSGARQMGRFAWWCYRQADLYVAISARVAANVIAAGLPKAKLAVAANGIDLSRFTSATSASRTAARNAFGLDARLRWILFVGFFSRDKAPDVLFDAWLRLHERHPDTGLLLVGATASGYHEVDRTIADDLRDRAAVLGLTDRVRFTGPLRNIEQAYHAADVFVMPSTREAFGMVLIEAMASGLPVVASRLEGVTDEIVEEGVTGRLVPPRDADAMADAISHVLADPARSTAMVEQARASVANRYGLDAARRRWLDVYAVAGIQG